MHPCLLTSVMHIENIKISKPLEYATLKLIEVMRHLKIDD